MGACAGAGQVGKPPFKLTDREPTEFRTEEGSEIMPIDTLFDHACGYSFAVGTQEIELSRRDAHIQFSLSKLQAFSEAYARFKQAYTDHCIDQCEKHALQIQRLAPHIQCVADHHSYSLENIRREIEDAAVELNDVKVLQHQIDKGGWNLQSDSDGVKISSRLEDDTVGVLVETILEIPFEIFFAVIAEMDLMKNFMPFMKESRHEKDIARNIKIGYSLIDLPVLSHREAFFQAVGYNRLAHDRSFFAFSRSLHNRPRLCERLNYKVNPSPKSVQMDYRYFIIKYEPIDKNRGKTTLAVNIDLKLSFLPMSILKYACVNFGEDFFTNVMGVCRKYEGSEWEQSTRRNPALSDYIKKCVLDYVNSL